MAGTQPDVPGTKFHLDLDGTYGQQGTAGLGWTPLTGTVLGALSDGQINNVITTSTNSWIVSFLFPQPRDIVAFTLAWSATNGGNAYPRYLHVSTDTTDGINGTWSIVYTGGANGWGLNGSQIWCRQNWQIINQTSVRGVQFETYRPTADTMYYRELSFYGAYTPSGLAFWHPTLDVQVGATYFDFGDLLQGQIYTKDFRIKNLNILQANNITLGAEQQNSAEAYNTTTFSLDGTTFAATRVIASVAAGATTSVINVKRAVGGSETLSTPNTVRYTANVQTWT